MEIEEMVDLLSEAKGVKYILRRTLEEASSMAKGFKYYVMELWELNKDVPTIRVKFLGQYTLEHRDEIRHNAEREFIKELFKK